jgi:hypothetical protein
MTSTEHGPEGRLRRFAEPTFERPTRWLAMMTVTLFVVPRANHAYSQSLHRYLKGVDQPSKGPSVRGMLVVNAAFVLVGLWMVWLRPSPADAEPKGHIIS